MAKKRHHDPEPFTVVVGIAGIVGGFASAVSLYRSFAPVSFDSRRSASKRALGDEHEVPLWSSTI
jgi:hypothetical protein